MTTPEPDAAPAPPEDPSSSTVDAVPGPAGARDAAGPVDADRPAPTDRPVPAAVVVRPRVARIAGVVAAAATLALFVVAGVVLPASSYADTGVYFRGADQVAIVVIGLLVAGGILLVARPRVRADADGIEVRNIGGARRLPWSAVKRVTFPDGAPWARLDIGADEYVPVLAIQAIDRQHAVDAIRAVRGLHAAATRR